MAAGEDTMQEQTGPQCRCVNAACGRALARPVRFCPYCGVRQTVETADEPASAQADKPSVAAKIEERPVAAENIASATHADSGPQPNAVGERTAPANVEAPPARPFGVHAAPPKRKTGKFVWLALAAAAVLVWYLIPADPDKPVNVTASPDAWTAVDIGNFREGSTIVISGDGPFRLRSLETDPILVRARNGVIKLAQMHRKGLEVKSAYDQPVHVRFSLAAGSPKDESAPNGNEGNQTP